MQQQGLEISIKADGNLELRLTADGKEYLEEQIESQHDGSHEIVWRNTQRDILWDLLESYSVNGSYCLVAPEEIGALTDAPIIADVCNYIPEEDMTDGAPFDGRDYSESKIWWFPDYVVIDPLQQLLIEGHVTFTASAANNIDESNCL